ncbi:hypothetical protein [Chryseobacterium sp. MFBS3-17]|uniref:hypothetical protein n=1 Tax=Chryseobacterium sp. MFBS3-17 TaxID=2886689 RepID=UPI001D0DFBF3|nr:hypothetical protein [Chryseobacterium sp. MFBS3-17]MCC2590363.1 hypothetical protein [Chryseobacterium sp. MFBS3-17]
MHLQQSWEIEFRNADGVWDLGVLAECQIEKSTKNLADTAVIILPETDMNRVLRVQDAIGRGDEVLISLGYDGKMQTEFAGYVREITTNDGSLQIECEDGLFLFRNGIPNKEMKPATVKQIAQYVIDQIDSSFTLVCDYDLPYDKFTIYQATGYDVLAKIQEETGADVFFDMQKKELHIHPAYTWKSGEADYSMQHNVETSSLKYVSATDRKVEVTVESVGLDGKTISKTVGHAGGEKITKKVGRMSAAAISVIAENEYKSKMKPGYEGTFDTWLIPYAEPSFTIGIYDEDYPDKDGRYYAESVSTTFSDAGGKRTITPGIKLSL